MWIFYLILILSSLLQTTFIPLNLILILILVRSFIIEDRSNYFVAFAAGIILGIMSSQNLGVWTVIFLFVVRAVHLIKRLPIFENARTFLPVAFLILLAVNFCQRLVFSQQIDYRVVLIEAIISLPIFWIIRVWEERFILKPQIKLRFKRS